MVILSMANNIFASNAQEGGKERGWLGLDGGKGVGRLGGDLSY